jgi:hypothetical protein
LKVTLYIEGTKNQKRRINKMEKLNNLEMAVFIILSLGGLVITLLTIMWAITII